MTTLYGHQWDGSMDPLEIEMECIRKGGKWNDGQSGMGLFHHYYLMQSLIWPEDDHHRWSNLILNNLINERIVVLTGSKDSGKTRTVSKWSLCDYWCFPEETLVLMTSTTALGLEMRVWGDIKSLFMRAKDRYPYLAGNVVDAKKGIFTDDLTDNSEVRDQRKGIVGIPTMTSEGDYQGLALKNFAGIKQKRRRLVGDELQFLSCFPIGTKVDTLFGTREIQHIKPGKFVLSAAGYNRVIATSCKLAKTLVRVVTKDGRDITCTPEHPFFTQHGWKKACELNQSLYMLGAYETMCLLREELHQAGSGEAVPGVLEENTGLQVLRETISNSGAELRETFLRSKLFLEMETDSAGVSGEALLEGSGKEDRRIQKEVASGQPGQVQESHCEDEELDSKAGTGEKEGTEHHTERDGSFPESSWRERDGTEQGRMSVDENVSRGSVELRNQDREVERERLPSGLQSGLGVSGHQTGNRSGWCDSRGMGQKKREGSEKGQVLRGSWVDHIEILKQGDIGFPMSDPHSGACRVYNLEVEGHPSYSVEGLIVHNCDYLKTLDAMDKGEFKGVFLGNPIAGNGKALDKVSEPLNGWNSIGEVVKTRTWTNKYHGITINLVGIDSPNFDPDTLERYPYLPNKADVDRFEKSPGGKDSLEWWSLFMGVRKAGVVADRVLTVEMVRNNGGFADIIWNSEPTLKIYGVDAGFGGDECVSTFIECGTEVGGREVMVFREQKVIPVQLSRPETAEDQIAAFVKQDCAVLGVPDSNVFIEAGMRATLAVSFGRIMSPSINAINFGGSATKRPVSNDLMVFDEKTQQKRLKTCYEHYSKFVTELAFSVRAVVESGQARLFPMAAAEEFERRKWEYVYGDRYELESKVQYKERNSGKSPNWSDSTMVAVEGARRLGFVIERLKDPNAVEGPIAEDWLETEVSAHNRVVRKQELNYS